MSARTKFQKIPLNFELEPSANESLFLDLANPSTIDLSGKNSDEYFPMRNIELENTGTTRLRVFLNNRQGFIPLAAGVIKQFDDDSISFIKVVNQSSTTAGSIILTLDNAVSQTSLLQALVNK